MTQIFGTRSANVPIQAKRTFDTLVPFSLVDQDSQPYADFSDWVLTFKASTAFGAAVIFTLTSPVVTPGGSYIVQLVGSDRNFEMFLSAADLEVFTASDGSSPDRFFYEISASGPAFGKWPLAAGVIIIGKSL